MWTSHSHCCLHSRLICIAMETTFQCFFFLIIFSLHKLAFPSCNTRGKVKVREILSQKEGSFLNISYLLNISENSVSTDTSRLNVEVCQNNNISPLCTFIRPRQSQHFTVKYANVGDDTLCVVEHLYFTSSMMTWEIKISQLLTRSITAIYLDMQDKTLHRQTVLHIPIDVKYPSKVTNLTVDGQEVNSTHFINEGEVNVCCSFNRGNPPAIFSLLDMNGMEIANKVDKNTMQTEDGEEHLKVSLSVRCQDDWPTIRCEGNGLQVNRSVSFLVRCAPQFVDGPVTPVSSEFEKVTFRVKAHTTIFNKCSLTPIPSQDTFIPKVKCNLSGEPPNLVLTLHPEDNIYQGIWKITLGNEIGSANTTVNIAEYSMSETTTPSVESVSETTTQCVESVGVLAIGLSCAGVLLVAVIVNVVVCIKIRTREHKNGSRGGNAQNETTNGNEGERTSKKSDSSTSSPGQAAGNGSKSGGSTPRSSSSGSDKPSTNPNYTSTALQEVEIHPYMDLHTRDPTYASTTSSKDPHMYMELKTLKALQPGSEKNGNDGYETPQVPGQANKSSDGYETPQPPREGRRRSATYANQGVPADPIQEEVNYYNEA